MGLFDDATAHHTQITYLLADDHLRPRQLVILHTEFKHDMSVKQLVISFHISNPIRRLLAHGCRHCTQQQHIKANTAE